MFEFDNKKMRKLTTNISHYFVSCDCSEYNLSNELIFAKCLPNIRHEFSYKVELSLHNGKLILESDIKDCIELKNACVCMNKMIQALIH